jgi:ribosomal protein S12 methylthiotransferase
MPQAKQKIGILSLGCPRNLVDSESILGHLKLKGYPIVDIDKADVAILNTCSFIEDAKKESIDALLELIDLKKTGRLKKIIVYGCLVQRYYKELRKNFPEVDVFLGRLSLDNSLERFSLTPRHYAYLKICEGCINNCSFCVIPKIKGKFVSAEIGSLLKKVDALDKEKISELNIIGQDITGYGLDLYGSLKLTEFLKKITQRIQNIRWIRLLYLYPRRISLELLELIRDDRHFCKYIDLPIQHINPRILKLMRRNTTKNEIVKLIERVRRVIPEVAIRTSLIVGFPSETEKEFRELLDFIKEVKFERLGVFIYSREEGTPAYNFKKQIPKSIKVERFNAIMSLQQEISKNLNKGLLNKDLDVMIDSIDKDIYLGRTQYDAPEVDGIVYLKSKMPLKPGDIVKAHITDTLEYDLVGEVD